MSDHHDQRPAYERLGEEPRWLDKPENQRKVTRGFFLACAVVFLLDAIFLVVHKHNSFESKISEPEGLLQASESWFGYYSLYGLVSIVALVAVSVGLRKLVLAPEDFYARDYADASPDEVNGEEAPRGLGDAYPAGEDHHG